MYNLYTYYLHNFNNLLCIQSTSTISKPGFESLLFISFRLSTTRLDSDSNITKQTGRDYVLITLISRSTTNVFYKIRKTTKNVNLFKKNSLRKRQQIIRCSESQIRYAKNQVRYAESKIRFSFYIITAVTAGPFKYIV